MAKIMNVEKEFFAHDGIVYTIVRYESGRISEYIEGKEPKTVKAWMEKNGVEQYEMNDIEKEIYTEKEIERNPFGMVACMESVKSHIETLHEDPFEMLAEYEQRAKEDVFFNKTMIDAVRQYIEKHELTQEQESEGEEMTAEQKREAKKEAREAIDKAIEAYKGTEEDTRTDLERQCDYIKEELEAVYNGELVADEDGCVDGVDYGLCEGDSVTMWDFFSHCDGDVLDIEYFVGSDGEYRGVRLMVACGGPNIYINTRMGEVEGYWWTDTATAWVPSEICNAIDDVWSEYYSMVIG